MKALDCNNETSLLQKGFRDASPILVNMEDIARYITGNHLHESTEKYRYFSSVGLSADADKEKKSTLCFTPSIVCEGGHGKNNICKYTGRCMVDFDDLPMEAIIPAMKLLENDPYVELSHITISGAGIRIIYQTDVTDICNHPFAYKQGNEYYSSLLHFQTDEKCKNATRCSVLCEDPHAYFNPNAEVMHIEVPTEETPKKVGRPRKKHTAEVGNAEAAVLAQLKRQGKAYVEGRYNEYVSSALYLMNDFGVSESDASEWAVAHFNDYNSSDVLSICHSAYLHTEDHGRRALPKNSSSSHEDSESYYASIDDLEAYIDTQARVRLNLFDFHREILMAGDDEFRPLTDRDENTLWLRAKKAGLHTSYKIFTSILNSEYIESYHPFLDFVGGLSEWDGVTDYISQLADVVETRDPVYFRKVFKKWFVAYVASMLDPQVINHQILTFIGEEGIYKTTFFYKLLPECMRKYFNPKIDLGSRRNDDLIEVTECMLICLEEIDSMNAERMNHIKASVTLPTVNARAAYAHNREYRPHNASFCATGNNLYFLPDGDNRRWLTEYVTYINSERLDCIPYEQLYAQAVSLYHSGFRTWFNANETKCIKARNEYFKEPNVEEELIQDHYRRPKAGETPKLFSITDIMLTVTLGLKYPISRIKLRKALDKLGFRYTRTTYSRGFLAMELTREEIAGRQIYNPSYDEKKDPQIPF